MHLSENKAPFVLPDGASADIAILAGDITNSPVAAFDFASKVMAERAKDVIYVAGNHEYYGNDFNVTNDRLRELFAASDRTHFLNGSSIEREGVCFWGATLWTSLNRGHPLDVFRAAREWSDYYWITKGNARLKPQFIVDLNRKQFHALREAVKNARAAGQKMVVVTHMAPSYRSISPRYEGRDDNIYFADHLDEFVETNSDVIKVWIHGHCHTRMDYYIGECRVICNPRGYIGETTGFDPFLTVDI